MGVYFADTGINRPPKLRPRHHDGKMNINGPRYTGTWEYLGLGAPKTRTNLGGMHNPNLASIPVSAK